MAWRVRPGTDLVWRSWNEDEHLVFDGATGDTHLINRVTAEVLEILGRSPFEPDALGCEVARSLDVDVAVLRPSLGPLLVHLQRLGLVESIP